MAGELKAGKPMRGSGKQPGLTLPLAHGSREGPAAFHPLLAAFASGAWLPVCFWLKRLPAKFTCQGPPAIPTSQVPRAPLSSLTMQGVGEGLKQGDPPPTPQDSRVMTPFSVVKGLAPRRVQASGTS